MLKSREATNPFSSVVRTTLPYSWMPSSFLERLLFIFSCTIPDSPGKRCCQYFPHLTEEEAETREHHEWEAETEIDQGPLGPWSPQLLELCLWTRGTVCPATVHMEAGHHLFVQCTRLHIMCNCVILFNWIMKVLEKETVRKVLLLFKLLHLPWVRCEMCVWQSHTSVRYSSLP